MPSFISKVSKAFKRMSKSGEPKSAGAESTSPTSATSPDAAKDEPTFSIQPHPAKTNDPADLLPSEQTGGLASNPNAAIHNAHGPFISGQGVEIPMPESGNDLQARQAALDKEFNQK
ncbi:hypothetical protein MKEN_00512800 [Mycena kentingensis (nom. inval.)]|nr:hypothetical protein MKEN_00512800 [Mycena kentingensis (nom. inval.)]